MQQLVQPTRQEGGMPLSEKGGILHAILVFSLGIVKQECTNRVGNKHSKLSEALDLSIEHVEHDHDTCNESEVRYKCTRYSATVFKFIIFLYILLFNDLCFVVINDFMLVIYCLKQITRNRYIHLCSF